MVTNRVIQEYIATQPDLAFVDLWNAMLTPAGQPRDELWVEDRVHPNHAGYLIRVKLTFRCSGPVNNPANMRFFLYLAARLVIPRLVPSLGFRVFLTCRLARVALAGFPCLSTFT